MSGYSSVITPREIVIDDSNYQAFAVDPVIAGQQMARGAFPTFRPYGSTIAIPGRIPVLDMQEIRERAEEQEAKKQRLSDFIRANGIPCKNQGSVPYCWIFGQVGVMEVVRVKMGLPFVSLSPASTGSRIKNFRAVGGWGSEALQGLSTMGCCPSNLWPDTAVNRRYMTDANVAASLNFRVLEWDDIESNLQAVASSCVQGWPVGVAYNWWWHIVYACDPIFESGRLVGLRIRNSWGSSWGDDGFGILRGSKADPNEAITTRSIEPYAGSLT